MSPIDRREILLRADRLQIAELRIPPACFPAIIPMTTTFVCCTGVPLAGKVMATDGEAVSDSLKLTEFSATLPARSPALALST